jgi:putative ABC transport system permease protein
MNGALRPGRAGPPARRRASAPWRMLTGEPGPGPALALALIALLGAFIAMAGPRELTSLQNTALQQTIRSAGQFGLSASYSYDTEQFPGTPPPMVTEIQVVQGVLASSLRPPLVSAPAQQWSGLTAPALPWPGAPPQAVLDLPPVLEVAWRTPLASHARLVSGSFPQTAATVTRDGKSVIIAQVAVTTATAGRLGLRVGSLVALGSAESLYPSDAPLVLRVTGLIRPTDPGSAFWTQDPQLAAPMPLNVGTSTEWAGGVFVGDSEVAAIQPVYSGAMISWSWEYPLQTGGLAAAQAPGLLTAIRSWINGDAGQTAAVDAGLLQPGGSFGSSIMLSATGLSTLTAFVADQASVAATVSVLLAGIVAALTILLLVGGVVVTGAYGGELALGRARGGSARQLALRIFGTTAGLAGPGLAAGIAAGIAAVPDGGNRASWILAGLVAATALAAPALLAAWQHRGLGLVRAAGRDDVLTGRGSARRLVAEATVLIVAAGGVLALRLRGLAPGSGFDPYLSSAPVLVAVAAGLLVVRVYPLPLRGLLRLTRAGRGMVGYLGVARAARSRPAPLLPSLALVVALTVIALGGLVRAAVSGGQVSGSWQQVGADAVVHDSLGVSIPAAARDKIAAVPGVHLACAAYVLPTGSALSASQVVGTSAIPVGVVVADPAGYAAAVADTPWPAFPARLLAPPPGAARLGGPVPVIASPGVVAAGRSAVTQLDFSGSRLAVRVAATAASTPALPGGGPFVVVPAWAASRLTFSVAPNTMLLMGAGINVRDLQAVAAHVLPGIQVTSRAAVLQAAAGKPLVRGSDLVFEEAAGAAAGCAVAAVLLGLLLSGRDRTRLATWLAAMGMTGRQGRQLAVLDALPLLLVAIGGAEIASLALGPLIGPGLALSPFTGSRAPVPLRPDLVALVVPAAGAVILIMAAAIGRNALARRGAAGMLRLGEGR